MPVRRGFARGCWVLRRVRLELSHTHGGVDKVRMAQSCAPFVALVRAVAHQQLTSKAASSILKRVVDLFPEREFPTPEDLLGVSEADLRSAGLSRAKIISVREIAAKTLEGIVP